MIASQETLELTIRYIPGSLGAHNGTLLVKTDAEVWLNHRISGVGIQNEYRVGKAEAIFEAGKKYNFSLKINNPHDSYLVIEDIQIISGKAAMTKDLSQIEPFSSNTFANILVSTSSMVKIKTNHMTMSVPLTIL